jgi:hypothetical protein
MTYPQIMPALRHWSLDKNAYERGQAQDQQPDGSGADVGH